MPAGAKPGERRGGRKAGVPNKANREVRELAGAYTPMAIKELGRLIKKAQSESARVAAIALMLERAHGKIPVSVDSREHINITIRKILEGEVTLHHTTNGSGNGAEPLTIEHEPEDGNGEG